MEDLELLFEIDFVLFLNERKRRRRQRFHITRGIKNPRGYSNPGMDVTRDKIGEQPKRDQNGTDMALARVEIPKW